MLRFLPLCLEFTFWPFSPTSDSLGYSPGLRWWAKGIVSFLPAKSSTRPLYSEVTVVVIVVVIGVIMVMQIVGMMLMLVEVVVMMAIVIMMMMMVVIRIMTMMMMMMGMMWWIWGWYLPCVDNYYVIGTVLSTWPALSHVTLIASFQSCIIVIPLEWTGFS